MTHATPPRFPGGPAPTPESLGYNPFNNETSIAEAVRHRIDLGGSALSQAGVLTQPEQGSAGVEVATRQAAKIARAEIARVLIEESTNPDALQFPKCHDMDVLGEVLKQLGDTPVGIGYGPISGNVMRAWTRFMRETASNYREHHGLDKSELVPVRIELPEWLRDNPVYDILSGCSLMDIEIVGAVNSAIAANATHCRIRFKDDVGNDAVIGTGAKRCTFIFEGNMRATNSFNEAANTYVHIAGAHYGNVGPMSVSRLVCEGAWEAGTFTYKGSACSWSSNVKTRSYNSSGY